MYDVMCIINHRNNFNDNFYKIKFVIKSRNLNLFILKNSLKLFPKNVKF